jgi:hypothetical protein
MLGVSAMAQDSVLTKPFAQESRVLYMADEELIHDAKHMLPEASEFQDSIVEVNGIAVTPDGGIVAGAASARLGNIVLMEFTPAGWVERGPFIEYVGTKPEYDHVAKQTGKVRSPIQNNQPVVASAIGLDGNRLMAANGKVMHKLAQSSPITIFRTPEPIRALAIGPNSAVAVGTADSLFIRANGSHEFQKVYPDDGTYSWAPKDVTAVAYDTKGRLWFGSRQGVGCLDGDTWSLYTGAEGLPYDNFTCAAGGDPDGAIWFGTTHGAIRFDGERWAYRASLRWLPDDHVNDIAVAKDGTAWIATKKGISRIDRKPITLAEKAKIYNDTTEKYNNRDGYIASWHLERRGDMTSATEGITDNDGQYTAMYGVAQVFRYAVTGDPEARKLAQRSFEACKFLVDVVPESMKGFPARVVIPVDWHEPVNEQYGMEYNLRKREGDPHWKLITPRFPLSEDGKYRWKCDTSSDELAGHYMLYALYYDLVAETEEEKEAARQVVRDITDHLIRNDYNLVDHDGTPTRWARFGPDDILGYHSWVERSLNSMMMLSMLKVAEQLTGDPKYAAEAKKLRDEYQYHTNVIPGLPTFPPSVRVPWDNNLFLLTFYPLFMYEDDPELLIFYRQGLENTWGFVSKQKNATWNMIYAACAERYAKLVKEGHFEGAFPENPHYAKEYAEQYAEVTWPLDDSLEMLRDLPLELIGWKMKNDHRLDFISDATPYLQKPFGWSRVDTRAFPINERGHVRQDRDGFDVNIQEGDGKSLHEGTLYLLPYWMGQYHGYLK